MNREIQTVGHKVRMRNVTVKRVESVSPNLKRITFTGEDLADFVSLSPDDHVKVFFPYPGEDEPIVPTMGPDGPQFDEGERKPIMRDYTPKRFDNAARELEIEFFIHGDGPGSRWAANAQIGQKLTVGGPRGSKIVPYAFDWYLMIGDEAAIPSFARRLVEMPRGARAVAIIEVENEAQKITLETAAEAHVQWVYRKGREPGQPDTIQRELTLMSLAPGDFFTWISMEKSASKVIRDYLLNEKGARNEWIKTTAYWSHA